MAVSNRSNMNLLQAATIHQLTSEIHSSSRSSSSPNSVRERRRPTWHGNTTAEWMLSRLLRGIACGAGMHWASHKDSYSWRPHANAPVTPRSLHASSTASARCKQLTAGSAGADLAARPRPRPPPPPRLLAGLAALAGPLAAAPALLPGAPAPRMGPRCRAGADLARPPPAPSSSASSSES